MYIQNNSYTIYVHETCSTSSVSSCTSGEKTANLYVFQKNEYAQYREKQMGPLKKTNFWLQSTKSTQFADS